MEPDTINGLTFPEMRTVLQRVSDGTIQDRDRAESAMLMLGMAGGEVLLLHTILFLFEELGHQRPHVAAKKEIVDYK